MSFAYFYGDQSESYSFYRFPKQLMTGEQFKDLSMDAKVLYGLMLDRMGLSAKNGWRDEFGRVFIYYTLTNIQEDFNCGHDRVLRMLAELDAEKGIGLIERKKQGQGKPTMIYVKQFTQTEPPAPRDQSAAFRLREIRSQDFEEAEVQTSENPKSRLRESRSADFGEADGSNNNKNKTDLSKTDPSIHQSDGWEIEQQVREQIDYPLLAMQYPYDDPDCILQLICEVLSSTADTIRIGNDNLPTPKVQTRYRRLTFEHAAYVLDSMRETTTKIYNIRAYLLTALYNAPLTIGPYYAAAVRHDFG